MRSTPTLAGLVLAGLAICAQAGAQRGLHFSHHDWEVACDNTGTCRAAGYQSEGASRPVSVLLTREAGPRQPVTGKLRIGEWELGSEIVDALRSDSRLSLHIDGERVGQAKIDLDSLIADLPEPAVSALLSALQRDSVIEWVHGKYRWHLSGMGATAVLLKMDDAQGRVGTPGALVRQGSRNEDEVPPAEPAPVVIARSVSAGEGAQQLLSTSEMPAVREAVRATGEGNGDCRGLALPESGGEELTVIRLSESHLLVSATCWTAAYNLGSGYWVVRDEPPYDPVKITESGSWFEDGTLVASHKSRGLGDCWSRDEWTWNGQRFVHTVSLSTGKCRLVAAGGAWTLPTLTTEVLREGGK